MGLFDIVADIVTAPLDITSTTLKKVGKWLDDLF